MFLSSIGKETDSCKPIATKTPKVAHPAPKSPLNVESSAMIMRQNTLEFDRSSVPSKTINLYKAKTKQVPPDTVLLVE